MTHPIPQSARVLMLIATVALLGMTAGCNTEGMWNDNQKPEAPTTNMAAPEGIELPDIEVADAREVDLVEAVLTHRAMYLKSLTVLHDYYRDRGYHHKRQWAATELEDLRRVKPYKYITSAEVPVATLRPTTSIDEANRMYEQGLALMKEGGHGIPILYRQDKMREALQVFKDLINEYPNSDKIDDAAFQCGEIHKEYFQNDEWIAVQWYERAHEWDPETPHPALFGAAVLYDYRLHDRARALELYQLVLEKESQFESNANFAVRRIQELTEGMDRLPEPSTRTRTAGHMPQEGEQSMGRGGTGDSITADATAPIVERTGEPGSGG